MRRARSFRSSSRAGSKPIPDRWPEVGALEPYLAGSPREAVQAQRGRAARARQIEGQGVGSGRARPLGPARRAGFGVPSRVSRGPHTPVRTRRSRRTPPGIPGGPSGTRTLTGVEDHPKIQVVRRRETRGRQTSVSPWCKRRRRRAKEPLREPVRAGHLGRGTFLLADRVGQARRGGAAHVFGRGRSASDPLPRGGDARTQPQVAGVARMLTECDGGKMARTYEQGVQASDEADGDRRGKGVRLPDPLLRGDEDRNVVEEGPVPELRLSEAQAIRRLFHTQNLTLPSTLPGASPQWGAE